MHQCLSEGGTIPGLALPGAKQIPKHEMRLTLLATPILLKGFLTRIYSLNSVTDRLEQRSFSGFLFCSMRVYCARAVWYSVFGL